MADNQRIPEDEGSSSTPLACSSPQKVSLPAPSGLVMIKPTSRVENLGNRKVVSSQVSTTGLAVIKPEERTSREENPDKSRELSSRVPTTGLAMIKPEGQTSREENMDSRKVVSSRVPTTGLAMIKTEGQTSREENLDSRKVVSSRVLTTGLAKIKSEEQTSKLEKSPYVQNPMTQPMNFLTSEVERRDRVSSKGEPLLEFGRGMNASSRRDEDAHTECIHQGIQNLMEYILNKIERLKANSTPFVQCLTTQTNLPNSDSDRIVHVFSDTENLLDFLQGMNAISTPDDDMHTGLFGAKGDFPVGTQNEWGCTRRISVNIPSPSEDPIPRCVPSPRNTEDIGMGLLTTGRYRNNSEKAVLTSRRYEDIVAKEFSSNMQDRDLSFSEDPVDKSVVDVAKQLWSTCIENSRQGEISEYLKLYRERSPENYDFAMNIMAHIELLNDNSWTATVSYFNENIKRMFTCMWNEMHDVFNDIIFQTYDRYGVLKLMMHLTQLSVNENFKFETFLKYCVLMCQLGVVARKRIFIEVPFYAICELRYRMNFLTFENLVEFMFDTAVQNYAERKRKI